MADLVQMVNDVGQVETIEQQQDVEGVLKQTRDELLALTERHDKEKKALKEKQRLERKKLEAKQEAEAQPLQKLLEEKLKCDVPGQSICCQCFKFFKDEGGFFCGGGDVNSGCGQFVCMDCCQTCDSCSDYAPFCASCAADSLGSPDCGVGLMCPDCIELHSETCESCCAEDNETYR